ncbi:hypothetical protein C7M61_001763 [Candidozyma pseudohaemuli]|uniref:Uncharacterized protein n=1 Tax=Candidozyma pseudohaemuli TaxID=418784 RepID=A0A2P7YVG8_9ASCO|nr:hypothetical protein C7M61_001763 [[Candida] pseudohaemulonii]PSK39952.1 hypothetical protein C7M61_001763 [[Candida] pseudohaemulonii]
MPATKKKYKKIDLSSDSAYGERTADFKVQQYDYNDLQSGVLEAEAQLESDLKYLLASQEDGTISRKELNEARKLINSEENQKRIKRRNLFTKLEEITGDMNEIVLSSDDELEAVNERPGRSEKKERKKAEPAKNDVKASEPKRNGKKQKSVTPDLESNHNEKNETESSSLSRESSVPAEPAAPDTKPKKKRNRKKKSPSVEPEDQAKNREKQGPKKISPAQVSSTILPEKEPVSTIIGLSPEQIVNMKLTDVKFKIISTNPGILKICRNVLDFVKRESEGLFIDEKLRDNFLELCVHVAMRESNGFNDVSKKYPKLMARLATMRELTLEHTRTTITESNRKAHQNNFDYTVFSYIGHIIIWASYLQQRAKKPVLLENFGFSKKDVLASMGGCHLWDRIRRDPGTINMKRWKHIQKFRQNFAFEEHQFVVILRFMHLGTGLC